MPTAKAKKTTKKSASMKKAKSLKSVKPLKDAFSLNFGKLQTTYTSQKS